MERSLRGAYRVGGPNDRDTLPRRMVARLLVRPGSFRHPRLWGSGALASGTWLFVLGAILCAAGILWGVLLFAVSGLQLWRAYQLLAPLPQRVRELERSRARVVDDSAARLRRIEQDLHDGAQAQMVAVAMKLGLAKDYLERVTSDASPHDIERVRVLVVAAHDGAKSAIAELRDLARGILPPGLDEGLGTALATLVARSDVPAELVAELPERPARAIEVIAYFCAAELLTNVAKHSGARHARLEVAQRSGKVTVRMRDDGVGGAHVRSGGGLGGLAERVRVVDGRLQVESPPGGPTIVTVELPSHA